MELIIVKNKIKRTVDMKRPNSNTHTVNKNSPTSVIVRIRRKHRGYEEGRNSSKNK